MVSHRRWGVACALAAFALALPASAGASFQTGLSGGEYTSPDAAERDLWWGRTVEAKAGVVRLNLSWREVARSVPATPTDPADPAYDFSAYDAAIVDAAESGIDVLLTVFDAPDYAEAPGRPPSADPGSWQPDPFAFGSFAHAVAVRYSGRFGGLPRVRHFQAWNEPNLASWLAPQWNGQSPASPDHYRRMLNAFTGGIKGVHGDNVAVTAGTAPYGDRAGRARMRPVRFWREVLCVKRKKNGGLRGTNCPEKAAFDVLAHHPINTSGSPRRSAVNPDDASTPDLGRIKRVLRAAERAGNVAGPARHRLWATEIWWESDPPDGFRGLPLGRHARYTQEALYLLWKQGAKAVINLLIRDGPFDPGQPLATLEAGIFFRDGAPKPALRAFRFPFVTERKSKRRLRAWGKAPRGGKLVIERKARGGWRRLERKRVGEGKVFTAKVRVRGKARLRAKVGGEKSLVWRQRR